MENNINNPNLIRNLDGQTNENSISYPYFFTLLGIALIVGIVVGFILTKFSKKGGEVTGTQPAKESAGIVDKKTFKDKAEGTLKEGGVEGEGNFHLERTGGESQNVYLTSSTVDLSAYINKKVRVWGETFKGSTAGWLMDVGLVEVLQ